MKKMGLVISLGIQSLMAWEPIANRFLLHTLLQRNKLIFCAQINAVRYKQEVFRKELVHVQKELGEEPLACLVWASAEKKSSKQEHHKEEHVLEEDDVDDSEPDDYEENPGPEGSLFKEEEEEESEEDDKKIGGE